MKNILSIFSLLVATSSLFAQSDPGFRQNQFNAMQLNPAQAGANDRNEINALSVNSWIGVEGAPTTFTASGNFNATNNLGVGFTALSDQIGPVKTFRLGISGAYHLPLNKKWKMSLGLNAFLSNIAVDLPSLTTTVSYDPHMVSALNSGIQLKGGWGLLVYSKNLYLGVSQPILGNVKFLNANMTQFVQSPSFITYAGADYKIDGKWDFRPNLVYRYVKAFPTYLNMTAMFTYDKKIDLGLDYQLQGSIGAILGVEINKALYVGYGYSFPTSKLSRITSQTHEIAVRVRFGKTKSGFNFQNPRFFN